MTVRSLTYISSSKLTESDTVIAIPSIVAASVKNNQQVGLTGALLSSGRYFVQVLEGRKAAIDALLRVLEADSRHCDMIIVNDEVREGRQFAHWQMAYVGPSVFVDRQVGRLIANPGAREATRIASWLETLLAEHDQAQAARPVSMCS